VDNYQHSTSECDDFYSKNYYTGEARSAKTGNNITFSYSNKDLSIDGKSSLKIENSAKRNSMVLMDENMIFEGLSKEPILKKELTFGNTRHLPEPLSLKNINNNQKRD
jgi:hypothetical protein